MIKIDLSIFNKDYKSYLQISEINQWLSETAPILDELSVDELIKIFVGLADLKIFDNKFLKILCDSISTKLADLSYSDLVAILYSLHELKYTKNIAFISDIVSNLKNTKVCDNKSSLVNAIWLLSKIGFYDKEFFQSWIILVTPKVNLFSNNELTKSIQAIANLNLFDAQLIGLILNKIQTVIEGCEPRTQLNIAFYLSMISINSFDNVQDPLKISINNVIRNIMQDIDLSATQDAIAKQQMLQIHSSGIYQLSKDIFNQFSKKANRQDTIRTSIIQKKVENYIRKVFFKYQVISEYYHPETASHIDLKIVRDLNHPECDINYQVEGPTHYFINHQPHHDFPIFNGATEYRNGLHKLNFVQTYPISYFDIDIRSCYPELLRQLHTFPEGYSIVPSIEDNVDEVSISSNIGTKESVVATKKSAKLKKAKHALNKQKFVDNTENFDLLLEEAASLYKEIEEKLPTYEEVERNHRKNSKSSLSVKMLLEAVIKKKNLNDIEVVLKHYESNGLDSSWCGENGNIIDLYEQTLSKISNDYKSSKIYIEIYALFLKYHYLVPELREGHLKALIYGYGYGNAEIFKKYLDLFPESDNKSQLMEYFMVNCGSLNHVEIANLLLFYNIDINSCYSRESAEVLYALSVGHKHNGRAIPNMAKAFNDLFKLISGTRDIISSETYIVEDLLQAASGGSFDKGDGIPEGRGVTALHLSSYNKKNNAIALFLLENDASPNTINKDGVTPLITALLLGNEEAALQILDFQPNVNLKAVYETTAAHIAARYSFIKVIKRIADLGGDFDVKIHANKLNTVVNADGKKITFYENETPLWIALKLGHVEIAKYLIAGKASLDSHLEVYHPLYIGATITTPEASTHSVLSYCIHAYPELVKQLLVNGAKANDDKIVGNSPLMIAAEWSNSDTQRNVAKKLKDRQYKKVFDKAEEFKKYHILEELLLYGADIGFKDKDGDTVSAYVTRPDMISDHSRLVESIKIYEYFSGYNAQIRHYLMLKIGINVEIDSHLLAKNSLFSFISYIPDALKNTFSLGTDNTQVQLLENGDATDSGRLLLETGEKKSSTEINSNDLSINFKAADIAVDTVRLINRPNIEKFYKLSYDVSYMAGILNGGGTPITLLISTPHIANKINQGQYMEAAIDATLNIGFGVFSYVIDYAGFPLAKELYKIQTLITAYQVLENMQLLYEEITDPDNALKSAEAYQNVNDGFSDLFYSIKEVMGVNSFENDE